MENLKSNSWLIDSNVENALERKWNVVSSRWKCVNFSSTLELESPRVVVFQKQKNRKMVWLSAQVRVKERVHIFMPKRKSPLCEVGHTLLPVLSCFVLSTLYLSYFSSSLPALSYPLSLSPLPVSSLLLPPHHSPPSLLHSFPSLTLHQVQMMLNLASRGATSLSWWHCESTFLFVISFISRERWHLQIMLGGPGNPINKVILELRLGKGKWQSWRCWKWTCFPEALRLTHSENCRLFRMTRTKDVFWRLARAGNTEVGGNQCLLGPGWRAEELNWKLEGSLWRREKWSGLHFKREVGWVD